MPSRYIRKKGRAAVSITAFAFALIVASGPSFTSAPAARAASDDPAATSGGESNVGRSFTDADDSASEAYWTPERMASAASEDGSADITSEQGGQIGASATTSAFKAVNWIGRLFFTSAGKSYSCTASSIKSESKLVIATAGHCLYKSGDWSTNIRFVPGYDGANKPLLSWGVNEYQVPRAWRYKENYDHDAGFIQLRPQKSWDGSKLYLADQAGATDTNFNLARSRLHYEAFGYKRVTTYTPQPLIMCNGVGNADYGHKTKLSIKDCEMVSGSSGGPVYHRSRRGVDGTQVGVVSQIVASEGFGTIMNFSPWSHVEYDVFRAVDRWGR